jgi:hypothetical protein
MSEIRDQEIRINIEASECAIDAITRYLNTMGFEKAEWTDGKGLTHIYFTSPEYAELWIASQFYGENDTVVFSLAGNK